MLFEDVKILYRYVVWALVCLLIDVWILFVLNEAGLFYLYGNVISFFMSTLVFYYCVKRFVFVGRASKKWSEFGLFLLVGVFGLFIQTVVLYFLVGGCGIELIQAKSVAIISSFSVSYIARKRLMAG